MSANLGKCKQPKSSSSPVRDSTQKQSKMKFSYRQKCVHTSNDAGSRMGRPFPSSTASCDKRTSFTQFLRSCWGRSLRGFIRRPSLPRILPCAAVHRRFISLRHQRSHICIFPLLIPKKAEENKQEEIWDD